MVKGIIIIPSLLCFQKNLIVELLQKSAIYFEEVQMGSVASGSKFRAFQKHQVVHQSSISSGFKHDVTKLFALQ